MNARPPLNLSIGARPDRPGACSILLTAAVLLFAAFCARASEPLPRIISLSPHATELVYAAGAGAQLIAVSRYSDYPAEAAAIERIGDAARIDRERIIQLQPDLVITWPGGNRAQDLAWLHGQGYRVHPSSPETLEAIADEIELIGRLSGHPRHATQQADELRNRVGTLGAGASAADQLPAFYQLWSQPLMTIGGAGLINEILMRCGYRNIYEEEPRQVFSTNLENTLLASPDVIFIAETEDGFTTARQFWQKYRYIPAVDKNQIYRVDADQLHRPTPRLLDAAEALCDLRTRLR